LSEIPRLLIGIGIALIILGLLWPVIDRLGLGRLPGDIIIERENVRFYFPLTTMIIISLVITVLIWLIRK